MTNATKNAAPIKNAAPTDGIGGAAPAAPAAAAPAAPKAPSLKSRALAIFQAKLVERTQGLFASNKEFRAAVLAAIQTDLGVTIASAATMFNAAKKEAEVANPAIGLGRDPKKEKAPKGTGKRGRPTGSKNKDKVEVAPEAAPAVAGDAAAPAAEAAPEVVAEVAPEAAPAA